MADGMRFYLEFKYIGNGSEEAKPMKKIMPLILFGLLSAGTIHAARIIVECPNGGEKWRSNEIRYISWRSAEVTGNVKITLWKDDQLLGEIAGSVAGSADILRWTVGQTKGGQAPAGSGYKIKIKEKETPVADMSDHSFEILPEEDETDLSLSACVMKNRSGQQAKTWQKGDVAKVEFLVKVPADQPCFKFDIEARSVHGQVSPSQFAVMGKTCLKEQFIFSPPWTEKAGYFYFTLDEEKTGPFTLLLKAIAVVPKKETNTRNNQCQIPFEMVVGGEPKEELKRRDPTFPQVEFKPNLKVSFHNMAVSQDSFNVLIENEKYQTAKISKEFLVYALFNTRCNLGRGWVNFEAYTVRQSLLDSLNKNGRCYVLFFSRDWIDAGATTCTVTVDSRKDIAESNENDNQCVIHF
jgi:hypothetical protein